MMFKLIPAHFLMDTLPVSCVWLACGILATNPVQFVKHDGKYFPQSVLSTGMLSEAFLLYIISSQFMFHFREQIETLYGELVIQRRQRYSQTEKDLIKRFLSAKEESTQELSSGVQKLRNNIASTKGSEPEWSNPTFPFLNRAIKSVVSH